MAPVKRSTATVAQRETRATRSSAIAKKRANVTEKTTAKLAVAPATSKTTRRGRKAEDEEPEVQAEALSDQDDAAETIRTTKPVRATRANPAPSMSLAAAPRRRVKVTRLDAPAAETKPTRAASKKVISKDTAEKKPSTRSKTTISDIVDEAMEDALPTEPLQTKSTRKVDSKSKDERNSTTAEPVRTRGRPKVQKDSTDTRKNVKPATEPAEKPVVRATRSQRAGSIVLPGVAETAEISQEPQPATGVRKKVTFQDLPQENDKENQPLPQSKSRKGVTKKKESESATTATGLRAKPARRAAVSATSTRGRRVATSSTRKAASSSVEDAEVKQKKMPRALTPKKITQVAKSSSPEHEDTESEDDMLNSGKTPVRDLSMSPKRPTTAALAQALSPSKKLDFGQNLVPKSPDRTAVSRNPTADYTGILSSPARRAPAPPFKDSLKESPKRGLHESAKALFPLSQNDASASLVLNPTNATTASHTISTMLQSPKRIGKIDPGFFSQSAMKNSVSRSPFKASLLGSPAKRLFSPAKKAATSAEEKLTQECVEDKDEQDWDDMDVEEDVTVSSHFRPSSSPLRVHRVEAGEENMDFDESVLQVRSPLKVQQSPPKQIPQATTQHIEETEDPFVEAAVLDRTQEPRDAEVIVPSELDMKREFTPRVTRVQDTASTTATPEFEILTPNDDKPAASGHGAQPDMTRRTSWSQVLFRSNRAASENDTSEDELSGAKTPIRPLAKKARRSTSGIHGRSRVSTGLPNSKTGNGFGFTPLAAQMSGWLASSPDKSPETGVSTDQAREGNEFSPLARQHIDGEVLISRNSTPAQVLSKRLSLEPTSSAKAKSTPRNRASLGLRKSLAQRQSLGLQSISESPARNAQFDEYMEIRAMEEQADADEEGDEVEVGQDVEDFDEIMKVDGSSSEADEGGDTILVDEDDTTERISSDQNGDLTTDLINFTHASDTAMVDFQKLAEEANELASDAIEEDDVESTQVASPAVADMDVTLVQEEATMVDVEPSDEPRAESDGQSVSETEMVDEVFDLEEAADSVQSPLLQPIEVDLDSPSLLVIDQGNSPTSLPKSIADSAPNLSNLALSMTTPEPNLRLHERRIINTVVSKVPLKPEGDVSPIKVTKKRSSSFGNSETSPAKRMSFEDLRALPSGRAQINQESPDRRVRSSAAPSPGGTSTPATTRSNMTRTSRVSFGGQSTMTTPGQMSFAVDDFGDSTLDGIELPDDEQDFESEDDFEKSACGSTTATPKAITTTTPATARRSGRHTVTPTTASKKTPATVRKTPSRASTIKVEERTPLQPVGRGVLHGATVFVDVHTSEGADASGVFIELLTQMGAKCVKDWRWNPRASLAPGADSSSTEHKIGITHVVYKDGGKRTLEKVRDTKGEVSCVGVAWVLDCERENQWLDESSYSIDLSLLPRGGSRRRKSMEPRALLISNDGSVSTSRARRSVSAEMSELMKRELVNTPARSQTSSAEHNKVTTTIHCDEDFGDNDDGDDDEDNEMSEHQATPTGFISYDPKVAMTPGTPYLVSQGKKLIQMSAPPKQQNKSLFDNDDGDDDDAQDENEGSKTERGNSKVVKDAKKFRMKNLAVVAAAKRRRTMGFRPVVGSPLGR